MQVPCFYYNNVDYIKKIERQIECHLQLYQLFLLQQTAFLIISDHSTQTKLFILLYLNEVMMREFTYCFFIVIYFLSLIMSLMRHQIPYHNACNVVYFHFSSSSDIT